jgi:nitroreductase
MSDSHLLNTDYPVLPVLAERYSPRAYSEQTVAPELLHQLFTAASSVASAFNEQPWRYIVTTQQTQPEAFAKLLSCLGESNQVWARRAPVLALSVAKLSYSHDNNANRYALHDVGAATTALALQAAALGLQVHQMAGFSIDKARTAFAIPEGYEPVAAFTIGYPGNVDELPEPLRIRETAPRTRKPLGEFVFEGAWPTLETENYNATRV